MKPKQLKEETPTRPEHRAKRVKTNFHYLTQDGAERPDPTPIAPPIGYRPSDPLHKKIRQMIISEKLAMEARENNLETLDEADDFDVGDDYDPSSPYEEHFDPIGFDPGAARRAVEEHEQARNAPRGSAEPVATPATAPSSAPSAQQPTGAAAAEGGATGVHPAAPPTPPPQATPTPRSPFWPRGNR